MAKTAYINARIEPDLKQEAETIFAALGLSSSEALSMFYRQVTLHKGMPFPLRLPNAETVAAIKDQGGRENYSSATVLMDDLWPEP